MPAPLHIGAEPVTTTGSKFRDEKGGGSRGLSTRWQGRDSPSIRGGAEGTLYHMMVGLPSKRLNSWRLLRRKPAPLRTDTHNVLQYREFVRSCGGRESNPNWTPSNPEIVSLIVAELAKRDRVRYGDLWEAVHNREGGISSKTTFNLYLKMLVEQRVVKRDARRKLPDGRWITVKRSRTVKYYLAKTSPLSQEAKPSQISYWIEGNLRNSKIDLLTVVEHCLRGVDDWKELYSAFERAMKLNLEMWWNNKERLTPAVLGELAARIEQEKSQLQQARVI